MLGTVTPCPYHLVHSKQTRQLVVVLQQSLVPRFHKTELTFDEPERVFHLGADAGLELLKGNNCFVFTRMLFELFELARAHGNRLLCLYIRQLFTVFCPLISRISAHKLFLAMEQMTHLIEVVLVG